MAQMLLRFGGDPEQASRTDIALVPLLNTVWSMNELFSPFILAKRKRVSCSGVCRWLILAGMVPWGCVAITCILYEGKSLWRNKALNHSICNSAMLAAKAVNENLRDTE